VRKAFETDFDEAVGGGGEEAPQGALLEDALEMADVLGELALLLLGGLRVWAVWVAIMGIIGRVVEVVGDGGLGVELVLVQDLGGCLQVVAVCGL
jgi:hypothetical protein